MENNEITFRYRNLCTSYRFEIGSQEWIDRNCNSLSTAGHTFCFSQLFNSLDDKFKYNDKLDISLNILINKDRNLNTYNNLVVIDKESVIKHIEYLKNLFDFEYKLIDSKNLYKLCAKLSSKKTIQIKFFCAWVRYLYEFPANVYMLDIYRLIDAGFFKNESPFNLVMLINSIAQQSNISIRSDQCIKLDGIFLEDRVLRTKLNRGRLKLNGLYKNIETGKRAKMFKGIKFPMNSSDVYRLDAWENEDRLADRYIIYEKALQVYNS